MYPSCQIPPGPADFSGKKALKSVDSAEWLWGGAIPETNEIVTHICSCHNFFPLSSVQIIIIPACCYCVCFKMIYKKSL